ncbi:MAG: hypothetical protein C0172_02680 [Caldisphaera sp.]|nr:MAG: hypothetical protein C0172_02680 [Caldisphaera sp.]
MDALKEALLLIIGSIVLGIILGMLFSSVLGQTIGIGVAPAVVKLNAGVYDYNFCFFNEGDTDTNFTLKSGDIKVDEIEFFVPANTNLSSCVKKTVRLYVDKSGYFYVQASLPENATIKIVRQIGVKVECLNCYTTSISGSSGLSSSGSSSIAKTDTGITNKTVENKTVATSENKSELITAENKTELMFIENKTVVKSKTEEKNINFPINKFGFAILGLVIILLIVYFFLKAF